LLSFVKKTGWPWPSCQTSSLWLSTHHFLAGQFAIFSWQDMSLRTTLMEIQWNTYISIILSRCATHVHTMSSVQDRCHSQLGAMSVRWVHHRFCPLLCVPKRLVIHLRETGSKILLYPRHKWAPSDMNSMPHYFANHGVSTPLTWADGGARAESEFLALFYRKVLGVLCRGEPPMQPWRLILCWKTVSPHALLLCVGCLDSKSVSPSPPFSQCAVFWRGWGSKPVVLHPAVLAPHTIVCCCHCLYPTLHEAQGGRSEVQCLHLTPPMAA
jgi:hypothetical protein